MVKFWLGFWKENKDVLIEGKLQPLYPELMYPVIISDTKEKRFIGVYSDYVIKSGINIPKELIIVNGTLEEHIVLKCNHDLEERELIIMDSCGRIKSHQRVILHKGIHQISVPASGVIKLIITQL